MADSGLAFGRPSPTCGGWLGGCAWEGDLLRKQHQAEWLRWGDLDILRRLEKIDCNEREKKVFIQDGHVIGTFFNRLCLAHSTESLLHLILASMLRVLSIVGSMPAPSITKKYFHDTVLSALKNIITDCTAQWGQKIASGINLSDGLESRVATFWVLWLGNAMTYVTAVAALMASRPAT